MVMFIYNLCLALIWALLTGELSVTNLAFGFVGGFAVLRLMKQWVSGQSSYFRKLPQAIGFALYFVWELIVASVRVAHDVLTPTLHMNPGILAIPVDAETELEITLLANLITLTPGTLSLDVSPDRKTLYIHAMFIDDSEALKREIKQGLERKLLELLR